MGAKEIVTKDDVRPGRPDGTCFYCRQPIGSEHSYTCVTLTKPSMVRVTVEIPMDFPQAWDTNAILFNLELGSRCKYSSVDRIVGAFGDDVAEEDRLGCGCEHIRHEVRDESTGDWCALEGD